MADDRFKFSFCITCGIEYGMPTTLYEGQRQHGGYHYCPNGHQQGWSKDGCELANTRRERDRLKQQLAQKDDEIKAAWQTVAQETEARQKVEREARRLKKRTAAGVCPCCNRSFTALHRHMATKHPDYNVVKIA